jgi:hypothetical protein
MFVGTVQTFADGTHLVGGPSLEALLILKVHKSVI